ncbi:keratin, type I cytoskeletal 19-like [Clinocottus analis]|uniref:keratin, type I cytoskeletal 19-like n=1 Tax=Clinocottus analis TaxID=304258 RepID=UPI0035C20EBF
MSVTFSRQSRQFSSRSSSRRSVSSGSSGSKEMQLAGGRQTRISIAAPSLRRAPSVYGGAGGFGTRISESVFSSGSLTPYGGSDVINNEKATMQNLNDRLATYLEKVRSLEAANRKVELQIREAYEKRASSVSKDFTGYFATITELRAKIMQQYSENQRIILQVDNAQLAVDDFRTKYEMELNMCAMVEADVFRIRGVKDGLTLTISDLEMQKAGLEEELVSMKNNHQEDLSQLRIQQTGAVNVEVDSAESVDLTVVLQEMREQYEAVVMKNTQELEKWFQSQVDTLQMQIMTRSEEVKTFHTELSELKRTKQSLEINSQSIFTEFQCSKQDMEEVNSRYSVQLGQLQLTINSLEIDLQQLRVSVEQQQTEYKLLLDIKMRLEMEIAEYRRLLDGELRERAIYEEKKAVIIRKAVEVEVEVEEHKPHIERRVRTIVEEIVDGKVVSSSVATEVEEVSGSSSLVQDKKETEGESSIFDHLILSQADLQISLQNVEVKFFHLYFKYES